MRPVAPVNNMSTLAEPSTTNPTKQPSFASHSLREPYPTSPIDSSQEEAVATFIRQEKMLPESKPESAQEKSSQQTMASPLIKEETSDKPSQQEAATSGTRAEETSRQSGLEGERTPGESQSPQIQNEGSDIDTALRDSVLKHPPQVGIATIRLQILSIRPVAINDSESDHYGDSGSDFNDESDEMKDADGGVRGGSASQFIATGIGGDSGGQDSGSTESPDQLRSHSSTTQKARKRQKTQHVRSEKRRLACPYQAFEPWLRCGAKGKGFEDMARLRYVYEC